MSEEKQLVNPDQESLPEIEKIDELLAQSLPDVSEVARKEIRGRLIAVIKESSSFFPDLCRHLNSSESMKKYFLVPQTGLLRWRRTNRASEKN